MEYKLEQILENLWQGEIDIAKAQQQILALFSVSPSLPSDEKLANFLLDAHNSLSAYECGPIEDYDYEMGQHADDWVIKLKALLANEG